MNRVSEIVLWLKDTGYGGEKQITLGFGQGITVRDANGNAVTLSAEDWIYVAGLIGAVLDYE